MARLGLDDRLLMGGGGCRRGRGQAFLFEALRVEALLLGRDPFLFESLSLESLLFSALGRNSLCFDAFSF
jgi:hypothetical protein